MCCRAPQDCSVLVALVLGAYMKRRHAEVRLYHSRRHRGAVALDPVPCAPQLTAPPPRRLGAAKSRDLRVEIGSDFRFGNQVCKARPFWKQCGCASARIATLDQPRYSHHRAHEDVQLGGSCKKQTGKLQLEAQGSRFECPKLIQVSPVKLQGFTHPGIFVPVKSHD